MSSKLIDSPRKRQLLYDITNGKKSKLIKNGNESDEDLWALDRESWSLNPPAICLQDTDNEDENLAWSSECPELFQSTKTNKLKMDNASSSLRAVHCHRHSSANTSLNESASMDLLGFSNNGSDNEMISIIESTGFTLEPVASCDRSSGYHSFDTSSFGQQQRRLSPNRRSLLNPTAKEFSLSSISDAYSSSQHHQHGPSSTHVARYPTSYEYKFGSFGRGDNEFLEPNGISFLSDGKIVIVDTNSSQVKIFDPSRRECVQKFGVPGTRAGAILYPYRIAVLPGDQLVLVQRSPRPMIQIFDKNGQFIRRFGNDLESPRAVCIDQQGRIIVIESKIMKVHIYESTSGRVWGACDLKEHLSFPTSVCVNDRHELYVSDNESHFVRVFDYNGVHLKDIGGGNISYPIACRINQPRRELIVVDNHENFNISIYDYDGNKKYSYYSLMKHAQCFDVAVGYNDELAMASKDYKIYVYKLGEHNNHYYY
ncbi:unnamed protein product [Didymodactylos carnosus]|uniref:Uncharacterized protein n=1 Tax=Didymodactylos carnosus TaxID=1234261 RepID=A0A814PIR7_9BILA|nr:unnamed protein product [Didymodactylos carnosus]CAF1287315.1 unnamed protein product [Didymodactylos carnosus]CAF3870857.1 unnamed protein product [Didymodactylos carnosus]CAF4092306.1 unnamed protein product [Didymodactylos carnosus]